MSLHMRQSSQGYIYAKDLLWSSNTSGGEVRKANNYI